MKVTEHISKAKKSIFSFEILPPLKGHGLKNMFSSLDPLIEFCPSFIDVTCHNEKFIYIEQKNGLLKREKISKRPGTIGICVAIMNKYGIDTVPHLICRGFNKKIIENYLIDLNFIGIDNVLIITGDSIEHNNLKNNNEYIYSIDLVKQIKNLNLGRYFDNTFVSKDNPNLFDFCIGVGGYPEKHLQSPNIENDIFFLRKKVEAGANYIITQMFFDNKKYFSFVESCRLKKISIPIIPGIKPISSKKQLNSLPSKFYLSIPEELVKEINKAKDDKKVFQTGIEWAIHQSKELKNSGVEIIHYYAMDKPKNIYRIVKSVF